MYGATYFKVPLGSDERLKTFPPLMSREFQMRGLGNNQSCGDIILSSAGNQLYMFSELN